MIRRKSLSRKENENPFLDISSLIDVSFLLLIYFLITSTLNPREGDLFLDTIPPGKGSVPVIIDVPLIEVNELGMVYFAEELTDTDDRDRELRVLTDRLKTYVEAQGVMTPNEKPRVELKVDDSVRGQRFIDVMNCLAGVGITDVTIHQTPVD